ncbi:MAG: hypothetical protein AB2809_22635 [Candidatus Thiodiazotropha sp.]
MPPIADFIPASIAAVTEGVKAWREYRSNGCKNEKERNQAIGTVMEAAVAIKAYLYDSHEKGIVSREAEREISQKWQHAATAIRVYDESQFNASQVKSLGWADLGEWEKQKDKAVTVNLDLIISHYEWLQGKRT